VKKINLPKKKRGKKIYEPPRYMTVNQCIQQLLEVEEKRKEDGFFCSLFFF